MKRRSIPHWTHVAACGMVVITLAGSCGEAPATLAQPPDSVPVSTSGPESKLKFPRFQRSIESFRTDSIAYKEWGCTAEEIQTAEKRLLLELQQMEAQFDHEPTTEEVMESKLMAAADERDAQAQRAHLSLLGVCDGSQVYVEDPSMTSDETSRAVWADIDRTQLLGYFHEGNPVKIFAEP